MKIRILFIFLAIALPLSIACHEEQSFSEATHEPTRDVRFQPLMQSFLTLIRILVAIITNNQVQNGIRTINELIAALIQTTISIKQSICAPVSATPIQMATTITNQESVKRVMLNEIIFHSNTLRFDPILRANPPAPQKPDETTQKVITHFGMIVQSFFNIVKDPENEENVTPNLINMLSNIVTIGAEVMKRSPFSSTSTRNEIVLFVISGIDERLKQDLLTTLYLTLYRNGVTVTP